MAAAIHHGDVAEFRRLGITLKREDPSPAHAYAWILLGQSIIERDHTKPDERRIAELVSEASPLLRSTGRVTAEDAARVLRTIFGGADSPSPNPLNDFLITVILLGALVADPLDELPGLRPHVIRLSAKVAAQAPQKWGYLISH